MLYLFNSAARPEYVKNVLNTLHLPNGAINLYQYETNDNTYVDPSIESYKKDEKVLITFIDRNDDEPQKNRYIPLRFGVLKKHEDEQGKSYFYVELGNFVTGVESFEDELKDSFKDKLFYKENNIENGYLAFKGEVVPSVQNNDCQDAWLETIKRVASCSKLKDNSCVYTHFELCNKKSISMTPSSKMKDWIYNLKANKEYSIKLHYYIPFANETSNADTIHCDFSNDLRNIISPVESTWGVQNGKKEYKILKTESGSELHVQYSLKCSNQDKEIVFSDSPISISFKKKSWLLKALPFPLFFISAFISTFVASMKDYAKFGAKESAGFFENLAKFISSFNVTQISIILAICAVIEALSLLWVTTLLSKEK